MTSNNAFKGMCLRAQSPNEKFKNYPHKKNSDGMQAIAVLYMTKLNATPEQ